MTSKSCCEFLLASFGHAWQECLWFIIQSIEKDKIYQMRECTVHCPKYTAINFMGL